MLLLDLDENGALGVVLNRPSGVPVREILPDWTDVVGAPGRALPGRPGEHRLRARGRRLNDLGDDPDVEPVGFRRLFDDVGIVDLDTPTEIVAPALTGMRIFAGYAGWGEEQLAGGDRSRGPGTSSRRVPADLFGDDPRRAVAAGAAPPARRARLGVHPAGRPDHELADPVWPVRCGPAPKPLSRR